LSDDLVDHLYWGSNGFALAAGMQKDFPDDPLGIYIDDKAAEQWVEENKPFSYSTSDAQGGVCFNLPYLDLICLYERWGYPQTIRSGLIL
jgi:hypothetical protein